MTTMRSRLQDLVHIQDNITHMNEANQAGEMFELEKNKRQKIIGDISRDYETLLSAIERIKLMTHPKYIEPSPVSIFGIAKSALDAVNNK